MNSDEYSVMDNKDLEAEIHPLKNEDGKAPDNHENCAEKEGLCRKPTRLSQLSRWRTAAFFLSLFLCLIVVFAFSFIIPCPVRPVSQRTWNRKYDRAVTYDFLAVEDVNEDKVQDVIFVFKDTNGSSSFNRSCSDEGLSAPCVFVTAVSGTNGSTLWERPVTEDLLWMECAIEQLGGAQSPGCLVIGNPELLTAISPRTEFPAYSTTESSLEILTVDAPGSLFTAAIQEILPPKGEHPSYFASSSPDSILRHWDTFLQLHFTAYPEKKKPPAIKYVMHPPGLPFIASGNFGVRVSLGEVRWRQFNSFGANYTVVTPLLKIPDVDGDGVQDVMIFTTAGDETQSFIYSGKKGEQIGTSGRLSLGARPGYLMHVTKTGSYYVVFNTVNSLYGYSLKDLYSMATGMEGKLTSLKQDPQWEKKIESPTHHIPLLSSGDIRYLVKVPERSGENILVVKSDMAELLNGQTLDSLWTVNTSHILREPVFGYYTPDVLHIVLESGVGPNRKKIMIVESGSGAVHWELELNSRAGSPRPATLNTADHRSMFLFWGEYQAEANETGSKAARQNLYLFHPSYPNVLLELNNSSDRIVSFDAVLFERSRHACCVLLTGPQSSEGPGWVSVAKRKLKEDITGSRVIWLSQVAGDSEQYIRDRFFRMRFSSQM